MEREEELEVQLCLAEGNRESEDGDGVTVHAAQRDETAPVHERIIEDEAREAEESVIQWAEGQDLGGNR